jgi:hypothetical protein
MIYKYITDSTATQVYVGPVKKAIIQVNAALTGSIKVIDNTTGSTANVATITNPAVGNRYEYWGLTAGLLVIASGNCDITVSADLSRSGV